jgi:chorismate synthase
MPGPTFGELVRVIRFGNGRGPAIGGEIDGCPPAGAAPEPFAQRPFADRAWPRRCG